MKRKENEGLESSSSVSADNIFLFYGCNCMSGKKTPGNCVEEEHLLQDLLQEKHYSGLLF